MQAPDPAKEAAGRAAAAAVEDGMLLGYGTGTTVARFLDALAGRSLNVAGVATSEATSRRCHELGLEVRSVADVARVDLVVDGADELTPDLALTKGGGAALLREKVVAQMADDMLVIASPDKVVDRLGDTFPIPVEVVPFAREPVRRMLEARGCDVVDRGQQTDNGNLVLGARVPGGITDLHAWAGDVAGIAGIAEHGLFLDLASAAVLGRPDGSVEWIGTL